MAEAVRPSALNRSVTGRPYARFDAGVPWNSSPASSQIEAHDPLHSDSARRIIAATCAAPPRMPKLPSGRASSAPWKSLVEMMRIRWTTGPRAPLSGPESKSTHFPATRVSPPPTASNGRPARMPAAGLAAGAGGGRRQAPVPGEEIGRIERTAPRDLVDEQLADVLLAIVHERRAAQHGVAAGAFRAVVRERDRERLIGTHRRAVARESGDAVAGRPREVDGVVHAGHGLEVVARDRGVGGHARRVAATRHAKVSRALLEVRLELRARDAQHAQRVLVRIELR